MNRRRPIAPNYACGFAILPTRDPRPANRKSPLVVYRILGENTLTQAARCWPPAARCFEDGAC